MPISDWFRAREARKYVQPSGSVESSDLPDGVWVKCEDCKRVLYQGELEQSLLVCPHCGRHNEVGAAERVVQLVDEGTFEETDAGVGSLDPLSFTSGKPYAQALADARGKTGMTEAVVTGRATLDGRPIVLAVMDFRFVGASMGSAVGEKVARAFELATAERRPLVLVAASGGARMQEGMLSLMQMAKTSAAAARLADAGVPFVAVLTNPTMGGVTASFATLADIVLAEPGARVGFAGPRLVEQTIHQGLPKGFQLSESLVKHGVVDGVVDRRELRERIALLLGYLGGPTGSKGGA
jgi:acetyl-CoA carboxylase carboxyl transferase subunit beta